MKPVTLRTLEIAADLITIFAAAAVCWLMLAPAYTPRTGVPATATNPTSPRAPASAHRSVPALPGVSYSSSDRTLLIAVRSDCRFCRNSLPFYQRIIEERHKRGNRGLQIVFASPGWDTQVKDTLAHDGVAVDGVLFTRLEPLGIPSTPTLLLVDRAGRIQQSWRGELPTSAQGAVLRALFPS